MAKENVKKFLEELTTNKELQEKFIVAQKHYEVEGKSEEEVFEDIVLPIAKEAGYEFTINEYRGAQRDAIAESSISEEELENVSGGWSGCYVIGKTSNEHTVACFAVGFEKGDCTNKDESKKSGAGVGFMICLWGYGIGTGGTLG